jgi:hypothetical protein
VAVLYVIYTAVRWLVADRGPKVGGEHARSLLEIEQKMGLDWELRVQQATVHHEWLVQAANNYYVYGFLPVLVFCTILGAWRAPAAFAWWRSVFAISLMLALVGFAAFPLTPPRLLPSSYGYVDTLLLYGPHYYGDATGSSLFNAYGSIPSVVNVYAAMPSMHIAWSIIAGALLIAVARLPHSTPRPPTNVPVEQIRAGLVSFTVWKRLPPTSQSSQSRPRDGEPKPLSQLR